MTELHTLAAVLVSLAGLGYLAAFDPKRRRVFRLPPRARRWAVPAWLLVLAPGAALLWAGDGAAFVVWLGAATVLGWLMASRRPPPRAVRARTRADATDQG
jgi:hypothetical protein